MEDCSHGFQTFLIQQEYDVPLSRDDRKINCIFNNKLDANKPVAFVTIYVFNMDIL